MNCFVVHSIRYVFLEISKQVDKILIKKISNPHDSLFNKYVIIL